jgi:4-amino-4-deoxy-L-arabinose transferase-like glycosyltransferase
MVRSRLRRFAGPEEEPWWRRHALAVLLLASALGFFVNLGGVPLFDRDEGAFSEATREMFERDDFVSTYLNGRPRYDKPILIYWCQAVPVALLGPREIAFRLPSAVFATLWVLAVFRFARPRLGTEAALAAGVLMATSLGVMMIGRAAIADALLNLLVTSALFDCYRYWEQPRRGPLLRAYLWVALGALTKGPVALLVPGAVSLIFFVATRRWRLWLRAAFQPLGWLVLLAVTLPWYLVQYSREGDAFLRGFFLRHNIERFASPLEGHGGAFYYYLPVFLLAVLPHTSLLIATLGRIRRWRHSDLDFFLWIWVLFVFGFFTVAGTKLPHYVYLCIAALFLLMGRYRLVLKNPWPALLPALVLIALVIALPWAVDIARTRVDDADLAAMLGAGSRALDAGYVVAGGAALVIVIVLGVLWRGPVWTLLGTAGGVVALLVATVVAPAVGTILQQPVKEAAQLSRTLAVPTVMWDLDNPSIGVYRAAATPDRRPEPGEAVITRRSRLPDLGPHRILYERGAIVLALLSDAAATDDTAAGSAAAEPAAADSVATPVSGSSGGAGGGRDAP